MVSFTLSGCRPTAQEPARAMLLLAARGSPAIAIQAPDIRNSEDRTSVSLEWLPKVISEMVGQTCRFAAAPSRAPPTISEMTFGNHSKGVPSPTRASRRGAQVLQVSPDGCVARGVSEHARVGLDIPRLASGPVEVRPPVAMLGLAFGAPRFPVHQHFAPALIPVLDGFPRIGELLEIPVPANLGVQDFVGPVVVLEEGAQGVFGGQSGFPLEPFAGLGHEALL